MTTITHIESLRAMAARRRREADISGPNDRADLLRLAMRDERLANQLEHESRDPWANDPDRTTRNWAPAS